MQVRVPQRASGVNVLSLPLSTLDGFVLSLIDGRAAVGDIAIISGMDASKLDSILERLAELGAVELPWAPRKSKPRAAPIVAPDLHFASASARYDAAELEQPSGITRELRKRILDAHYAIEGQNHYQVLGVARDAEKVTIRAAYFELSKVFHPDSQFGKDLGPYRARMEGVFKRLTEAYEVLGKKTKRVDYDEYLALTEQTRRVRRTMDRVSREVEMLLDPSEVAQASAPVPEPNVPDRSALRPPRVPSIAGAPIDSLRVEAPPSPTPSGSPPQVSVRPSLSNEERRARVRERLRQRLKHSSSLPPLPASPAPVEPAPEHSSSERRRSAIEGLRHSIAASAVATRGDVSVRAQTHLRKAQDAERAGDMLTASGELQLALACEPESPAIQHEYERVSKVVARSLATNYEKQAIYEEKTGNWLAAANSWGRVSDNREDDAEAARHAAEALLKASGDLHRAQRYAQKVVQLAGATTRNLTLLGRVYLAAGLKLNAQRELEKAAKLDPRDQIINNLLREARS